MTEEKQDAIDALANPVYGYAAAIQRSLSDTLSHPSESSLPLAMRSRLRKILSQWRQAFLPIDSSIHDMS